MAAIAANSRGNLILLHRGAHPVMEFEPGGKFLRSWGDGLFSEGKVMQIAPADRKSGGSGYSAVYGPAGCTSCGAHSIRFDSMGNVWLVDAAAHTVSKMTADGKLLLQLGKRGESGGGRDKFNLPTDVGFAPNGDIYVSDGYGSARVVKFAPDGKYITSWGKRGNGPGEFQLPHNVVVDASGKVYVSDRDNRRVEVFDENGKYLTEWATGGISALAITKDQKIWTGGVLRSLDGKPIGKLPDTGAHGSIGLTANGDVYLAQLSGVVHKFVKR